MFMKRGSGLVTCCECGRPVNGLDPAIYSGIPVACRGCSLRVESRVEVMALGGRRKLTPQGWNSQTVFSPTTTYLLRRIER